MQEHFPVEAVAIMNAGSILHDRYALFDTEGSFYSM